MAHIRTRGRFAAIAAPRIARRDRKYLKKNDNFPINDIRAGEDCKSGSPVTLPVNPHVDIADISLLGHT
jgi:hypothetical protein